MPSIRIRFMKPGNVPSNSKLKLYASHSPETVPQAGNHLYSQASLHLMKELVIENNGALTLTEDPEVPGGYLLTIL